MNRIEIVKELWKAYMCRITADCPNDICLECPYDTEEFTDTLKNTVEFLGGDLESGEVTGQCSACLYDDDLK